jgi:acyl-CoA thioesterase
VRATQEGRLIAEATVVATTPAEGVEWQRSPGPGIPEPDVGFPSLFGVGLGRGLFEVAHPRGTDPDQPPSHPLWVRSAVPVIDDPWLAGAVLAYWSDFGMNWITRSTHHVLSDEDIASLSATHVLWLHRPARVDRWHVLDVACETIAGNHGFVNGTLHDETGHRIATLDQRVFIRRPAP